MSNETFSTPMMQQYAEIKKDYQDCLLFFRMGDFYELFMDDAKIGAEVLDITLTSRQKGKDGGIPMCGVPYHSVETYIGRLVNAGYKVAVCEQTSDPDGPGLVEREVVRVVTPATILDENAIPRKESNYLMALEINKEGQAILAFIDLGTADVQIARGSLEDTQNSLENIIAKFAPKECIVSPVLYEDRRMMNRLKQFAGLNIYPFWGWKQYTKQPETVITEVYDVVDIEALGLRNEEDMWPVMAVALGYLQETQKGNIKHLAAPTVYRADTYVEMDRNTIINLELFRTIREGDEKGSLIWLLDQTRTAMGGRLLRQWLTRPSRSLDELNQRQDIVGHFVQNFNERQEVQKQLENILDMERILGRLHVGSGTARDLAALRQSLQSARGLQEALRHTNPQLFQRFIQAYTNDLDEDRTFLEHAVKDEPAATLREGNMIREGYNQELDELRGLKGEGKQYLTEFEQRERAQTGIPNLKVNVNKVFGYYIEVSNSHLPKVPQHYIRKQTLVNAERFITHELKEYEEKVFSAEERIIELEYQLIQEVIERVLIHSPALFHLSKQTAYVDVLTGFAQISQEYRYVRPEMMQESVLELTDSRHPVVEQLREEQSFVPNDCHMDDQDRQVMLLTGPNMAGKSTYIRQVAIVTLLAHLGCFVPCKEAKVGVVDKLFTRVGASDNLSRGLSTFMVEMIEVANILNHATSSSLIILDEVGRGTSTYDGVSIAWAVVEFLVEHPYMHPKTLFATHFHELLELGETYENVHNYQVVVEVTGNELRFLHRVESGGTDKSYGIQVAKKAGLPEDVVERAQEVLAKLEQREEEQAVQRKKTYRTTGRGESDQQMELL